MRGGAAECRGAGAGLEVVARGGAAERHVEMRVGVDAAGEKQHACGVDHPIRRACRDTLANLFDFLAFDQDVGRERVTQPSLPCRCESKCSSGPFSFLKCRHALFPGFRRPSGIDLLHRDAAIHRANQRSTDCSRRILLRRRVECAPAELDTARHQRHSRHPAWESASSRCVAGSRLRLAPACGDHSRARWLRGRDECTGARHPSRPM